MQNSKHSTTKVILAHMTFAHICNTQSILFLITFKDKGYPERAHKLDTGIRDKQIFKKCQKKN